MLFQIPPDVFLLIASKKFYYSLKQPGHLKLSITPVTLTHLLCLCFGNFQEGCGGRVVCTPVYAHHLRPKIKIFSFNSCLLWSRTCCSFVSSVASFWSALSPNHWSNVFVPDNSPKCAGKSKVIERKAPLQLPCRTSFPCPHHFYKQLLMRKVGIWCGEWEEDISLERWGKLERAGAWEWG